MDRAANLAAKARDCLEFEKLGSDPPGAFRASTRKLLVITAANLGFAHNEISAAVDEALTAAGTTP